MKRIALLLLLLLAACAERIPPTPTAAVPTPAPTETPLPPTATETPTPTPTKVDVNALFSAHPDFAQALISQDAKMGFCSRVIQESTAKRGSDHKVTKSQSHDVFIELCLSVLAPSW